MTHLSKRALTTCILLAAAALATPAIAGIDVGSRLEYQVSSAGAEAWSSSINAFPGESIDVRVRISYVGSQSPLGLGDVNFQPTVSNWDSSSPSTDSFGAFANGVGDGAPSGGLPEGFVTDAPGQYGRIRGYARSGTNTITYYTGLVNLHNGINYLRIAHSNVTAWQSGSGSTTGSGGIDNAQWTPGFRPPTALPFDTRLTDIVISKFNITLSTDAALRDLIVDTPNELFGNYNTDTGVREAHWVANTAEVTGSIGGSIITVPAEIHVPTPAGGAALLLAAPLAACRRKRARTA